MSRESGMDKKLECLHQRRYRNAREEENCMTSFFFTEGWFPARVSYKAGVRGSRTTAEQLGLTRDRSLFIAREDGGF